MKYNIMEGLFVSRYLRHSNKIGRSYCVFRLHEIIKYPLIEYIFTNQCVFKCIAIS